MANEIQFQGDKLIPLRIGGVDYQVPDNSSLLRCFQYLQLYPISMGGFCWSDDCHTCEVEIQNGEERKKVLSCQTMVVQGMVILGMTDKLKFCLRELLRKGNGTGNSNPYKP